MDYLILENEDISESIIMFPPCLILCPSLVCVVNCPQALCGILVG